MLGSWNRQCMRTYTLFSRVESGPIFVARSCTPPGQRAVTCVHGRPHTTRRACFACTTTPGPPMLPSPVYSGCEGQRRRQGMGKVTWALIMPRHAPAHAMDTHTGTKRQFTPALTYIIQWNPTDHGPVIVMLCMRVCKLVLARSGCHCCPLISWCIPCTS
jgi:hypothetical protein